MPCSGKHRGLGVHISFVRSVSMDAWNPDQLKKMSLGGNDKLNSFLSQYGVAKETDIRDKYNSKAAEFYREKIRAECEGRSYTPPPPSAVPSMARPKSYAAGSSSRGSGGAGADSWDDWGDSKPAAMPHSKSMGALSSQPGSEYTMSQLQASAAHKEDFFSRKMAENASRPDHLPPSQGAGTRVRRPLRPDGGLGHVWGMCARAHRRDCPGSRKARIELEEARVSPIMRKQHNMSMRMKAR